ncbi:MAG TPA: glycosyltransferase family 39 protein [Acidobacteriota bacterium]|nr:glycosyltransferase family 39 protein [Acidobacteriota bacterium]
MRLLLAAQSYWYDEAYLLINVKQEGLVELLAMMLRPQAAPPVYVWILRALYQILGMSECVMRLPAAIGGALSVILALPLSERLVGKPGSLWVLALSAASFHGLTLSNEVKPYAIDALLTETILFAGITYLAQDESVRRWGNSALAGLVCLGAVGAWVSYPAAYALAGVGVAWVVEAVRRRQRAVWLGLALYGCAVLLSWTSLWYLAARHQRTPELTTYWQRGFINISSAWSALATSMTILRKIGDYASTGLGIPLLLLVPVGWAVLARRGVAAPLMLVATLLFALLGSGLMLYPLDDRLTFFAAPLFWLSAAAAIAAIVERLVSPWGWLLVAGLLLLPAADLVRVVPVIWRGSYGPEFREAYQYFHTHRQRNDLVWQPFPEVYEIYHGLRWEGFNASVAPDQVVKESCGHRLWLITPPDHATSSFGPLARLQLCLMKAGWAVQTERRFRGLLVLLYEERGPAEVGISQFGNRSSCSCLDS